jgi:transposase, IS5 family
MGTQPGFFDIEDRLKRLSDLGDQLKAYAAAVDFAIFRSDLEKALNYSDGAKGGRPPFDPVLMMKVLVIQAQSNLLDDRAEFLISDRLTFMRFLGLGLHDKVPDARTIWAFRERLTRAGAIDGLFKRFEKALQDAGYIAMSGPLVDSTLIAAPKQRNSDEEKRQVKDGKSAAQIWPENPAKARQKDTSARWTVQFGKARLREDGRPMPNIAIPSFG